MDLWGPAAVRSINGNYYLGARINDTTHETKLYFQEKKSQTFKSYKMKPTSKPKLETK